MYIMYFKDNCYLPNARAKYFDYILLCDGINKKYFANHLSTSLSK